MICWINQIDILQHISHIHFRMKKRTYKWREIERNFPININLYRITKLNGFSFWTNIEMQRIPIAHCPWILDTWAIVQSFLTVLQKKNVHFSNRNIDCTMNNFTIFHSIHKFMYNSGKCPCAMYTYSSAFIIRHRSIWLNIIIHDIHVFRNEINIDEFYLYGWMWEKEREKWIFNEYLSVYVEFPLLPRWYFFSTSFNIRPFNLSCR